MANNLRVDIDEWKDNRLSPYCLESCTNTCCSGNYNVAMNFEQVDRAYNLNGDLDKLIDLLFNGKIKKHERAGYYWVPTNNGLEMPHCIAYNTDSRKCSIQDIKPADCKEFPVIMSQRKNGKPIVIFNNRRCGFASKRPDDVDALINICKAHSISFAIDEIMIL